MDLKTLYWLAGIIEGEGSFGLNTRGRKGKQKGWTSIPTIQMASTDKDIIDKVANIFKCTVYGPHAHYTKDNKKCKDSWSIIVRGNKAIQWMLTLYSLMGNRRKSKIEEVVDYWKNNHTGRIGRVLKST